MMDKFPIRFKNTTGSSIPAYSIIKLSGGTRQTSGELNPTGALSTATGTEALCATNGLATANNKYGWARSINAGPFWVTYNPSSAPANGDEVGPVSGQAYVDATGSGIIVIYKDTAKGLVLCDSLGGGATPTPGTGANGSPWTTAEYDAVSGDIVMRFDRGIPRSSLTPSITYDLEPLLASDGFLYTHGTVQINRDNGIIQKWDTTDPAAAVWGLDRNGLAAVDYIDSTGGTQGRLILESEAGFLWLAGQNHAGENVLGRVDTSTGLLTHTIGGSGIKSLFPCPTSGSVVIYVGLGAGNRISIVNNAGSTAFNYTTAIPSKLSAGGGKLVLHDGAGTGLYAISATDLSAISNRSAPGAALYAGVATDGTTVWTVTTTEATLKYRWYDVATLTEISNATRAAGTPSFLVYDSISSYLWACYSSGGLRRVSPTTGAEAWSITQTTNFWGPTAFGIGSDFVICCLVSSGSSHNITCINKSDGSVRWYDNIPVAVANPSAFGVFVSSDDRIFVSGARHGP